MNKKFREKKQQQLSQLTIINKKLRINVTAGDIDGRTVCDTVCTRPLVVLLLFTSFFCFKKSPSNLSTKL